MAETFPNNEVTIATLVHPPERTWPDAGLTSLIQMSANQSETSLDAAWEPRDFTESDDSIRYVPMNSSGYASFVSPGYVGTANLNGCTAVAASYQGERDGQEATVAFLAHYDSENIRQVGDDGTLKVSRLLATFAGQQPLRVVIAYAKDYNPFPPSGHPYDPEYFPVDTLLKSCQELPNGSSVLAIPYATSSDFTPARNRYVGNILSVGLGGSYVAGFGWNGRDVEVGKQQEFDERRRNAARAMAASYVHQPDDYEADLDH